MILRPLTKDHTCLYKALAILMIVTHNFMHLFPAPKQNEFAFYSGRFFNFLKLIAQEPENIFRALLSFYGHYGVQIFIFLSAYGLTKKYISSSPKYWTFIGERLSKIYPAFILSIVLWSTTAWFKYGILGPIKLLYWNSLDLIYKLTLISNFLPEKATFPVGPWWFIPMIAQFYFVFPLLFHLQRRWGNQVLLFISIASIIISILNKGAEVNFYYLVIGHLPEIALGIYIAKKDTNGFHFPGIFIIVAIVFFFLGNVFEIFWYMSAISVLVVLLVMFQLMQPVFLLKHSARTVFLLFIGSISM